MAIWESMRQNLDDAVRAAREIAQALADRGQVWARGSRSRWRLLGLDREARRRFLQLGERVFDLLEAGTREIAGDSDVEGHAEALRAIRAEIRVVEAEIRSLGTEFDKQAPPA